MKKNLVVVLGMTLVLLVFSAFAYGAGKTANINYPKKQLKIVVPGGAGGNMSVTARMIAKYLGDELGKQVVVENRAGAGGIIGASEYLLEKADSDAIIVLPSLIEAVAPLYQKVIYKADDFIPIIGMTNETNVVLANPAKSGINSWEDLVKYAKGKTIKFGSGGPGAYNCLAQDYLYKKARIKANTIPHKSAGEGITNLLGGHVDVTLAAVGLATDYVKDGALKPLFVLSNEPYTGYPGIKVPSIKSFGFNVNCEGYVYFATRKGTNKKIIDYLYNKINAVYQNPKFQDEMTQRKITIVNHDSKTIKKYMAQRMKEAKKYYNFIK
jgi:tripartite-type tricarboxylate transporter receptor subunit TctC